MANGKARTGKKAPDARAGGKVDGPKSRRNAVAPMPVCATFDHEHAARADGHEVVAGVDEAGRGPWAGPVVAAAVVLDPDNMPSGIADSKMLSEARREALFERLLECAEVGIAFADAERVDRDNVLAATMWAMREAVAQLMRQPHLVLVDGNRPPALECSTRTIVRGDQISLSIAAASIVAKVSRDRMMRRLDELYPGYGFARHKGYGTAEHSAALASLGASPLHRRSFAPVQAVIVRRSGGHG